MVEAFELQQTGVLLLAAAELSKDRYVLTRYSRAEKEWRVSVRLWHPKGCRCVEPRECHGVMEHVSASEESLMVALDRAVQWLRVGRAQMEQARNVP